MNPIRSVKGMNDALPAAAARFAQVESAAREVFRRYGFGELRTPILEEAALFQRGIGDATDVVEKEMYIFPDRHGVALALRPEGTAAAVRAYLQHNPAADDPLTRWFYLGPMFRHERPQKGRYRQFQQVGAELLGADQPEADVELVTMIADWLARLGLAAASGLTLELNSIGDAVCRPAYLEELKTFLRANGAALCEDCRRRTATNPLRTLDCKNPNCQAVLAQAPMPVGHLCEACAAHYAEVRAGLEALQLPFHQNPRLVRGLDYYTRTTFEFVWRRPSAAPAADGPGLGSQNTVAAGGRYDGLVEALGGVATPAVGFAAGVERLVLALGEAPAGGPKVASPDLFVATLGAPAERRAALQLAASARAAGFWAELDLRSGSLKSQLRRADKLGAKLLVILGADELASGRVKIKQLAAAGTLGAGQAREVAVAAAVAEAQAILGSPAA